MALTIALLVNSHFAPLSACKQKQFVRKFYLVRTAEIRRNSDANARSGSKIAKKKNAGVLVGTITK